MDKDISSANKEVSIRGLSDTGETSSSGISNLLGKNVRQRWIIVGSLSAITLAIVATWASSNNEPKKRTPKQTYETVVDTTPKGISQASDWKAQTSSEMIQMRDAMERNQITQRELLERLSKMDEELRDLKKNGVSGTASRPAASNSRPALNLPTPPKPPQSIAPAPVQPQVPTQGGVAPSPSASNSGWGGPATVAPAPVKRSPAKAFGPGASASKTDSTATELTDMVQNERAGFLPGGSFADATLISGVEAFTGGTAQSQPQPIVIRINENAILPNAAKYKLKGCHVLASVWGDMSSERVYGRLATLTCVDSQNKLVLSEEVEGVLVDSDGKNGIRGVLQDRQGAKLARALLAGFAEGLSAAFGAAQSTVTQTGLGTTSALIGGNAVKAGAYGGAEQAADKLADFYMKQAEATLPIIAVDAGRNISVLFTKSKSLKFETTGSYRVDNQKKVRVELPVN